MTGEIFLNKSQLELFGSNCLCVCVCVCVGGGGGGGGDVSHLCKLATIDAV